MKSKQHHLFSWLVLAIHLTCMKMLIIYIMYAGRVLASSLLSVFTSSSGIFSSLLYSLPLLSSSNLLLCHRERQHRRQIGKTKMQRKLWQVGTTLKEHSYVSYAKITSALGFSDINFILIKTTPPDDFP